jgi:putative transposase
LPPAKILSVPSASDERPADPDVILIPKKSSERSIRRWVKGYESFQLAGLYDRANQRGGGRHQIDVDALALMSSVVLRYISDQKPSKENIYEDVLRAFKEENAQRAEKREQNNAPFPVDLRAPSRETVRRAINNLDQFHCTLVRDGLEEAQKQFRPVGRGLELTRPLQRVEMDAWTVDLMTIMATSGLMSFLSEEDKARLGLDKGKGRWLLTVAICATTRCIVGMRLVAHGHDRKRGRDPRNVTRDKGVWADAVGALSAWHQRGTPELLVMDCAKSFISYDLRLAVKISHSGRTRTRRRCLSPTLHRAPVRHCRHASDAAPHGAHLR